MKRKSSTHSRCYSSLIVAILLLANPGYCPGQQTANLPPAPEITRIVSEPGSAEGSGNNTGANGIPSSNNGAMVDENSVLTPKNRYLETEQERIDKNQQVLDHLYNRIKNYDSGIFNYEKKIN